jgi:ankyrin repeat protein
LKKNAENGYKCNNESIYYIYKNYSDKLLDFFIKESSHKKYIKEYALEGACRSNNLKQVEKLLSKDLNLNNGLIGACNGGHIDLAKKMIDYGADDFDIALTRSCICGNEELINFFLSKPIKDINTVFFDFIVSSYKKKHIIDVNIVQLLINAGVNNFNNTLCYGVDINNEYIVDLMLQLGADDFSNGLEYACKNNNEKLIDFFIEKKASIDFGFYGACKGGQLELAKKIYNNNLIEDLDEGLFLACEYGHINIIGFLIEKGIDIEGINYSLAGACKGNNLEIVELMIKYGANNFDYGLLTACEENNVTMAKLMIIKGADNFEEVIDSVDLEGDLKDLINQFL